MMTILNTGNEFGDPQRPNYGWTGKESYNERWQKTRWAKIEAFHLDHISREKIHDGWHVFDSRGEFICFTPIELYADHIVLGHNLGDIQEIISKISEHLGEIRALMEKQYVAMFNPDGDD